MALTDARIVQLARQQKEQEVIAKEAATKAAALKKKIQDELIRRNINTVTIDGIKLTVVRPEPVQYDFELLQAALSPKQLRAIQKTAIDATLLAHAVQGGKIDPVIVSQCSYIAKRAPYILIN